MKKIVIAYVPVLHAGYKVFFEKHTDADKFFIFGKENIAEFDYLAKEIRALDPEIIVATLNFWKIGPDVEILTKDIIASISQEKDVVIVIPNEDVTKDFIEKYLPTAKKEIDQLFLRWDKHKSMEERPVVADQTISESDFDKKIMQQLKVDAEASSDWWRKVGAAIFKDGKLILAGYNQHTPSPHSAWSNGDPRNAFHKGIGIEFSTVLHGEAGLIAEAARQGIALEGASMYATIFPCPPCAKQIAYSGIKKLYYSGGYTILDQDELFRNKGVEIIYVDIKKV